MPSSAIFKSASLESSSVFRAFFYGFYFARGGLGIWAVFSIESDLSLMYLTLLTGITFFTLWSFPCDVEFFRFSILLKSLILKPIGIFGALSGDKLLKFFEKGNFCWDWTFVSVLTSAGPFSWITSLSYPSYLTWWSGVSFARFSKVGADLKLSVALMFEKTGRTC